MSGTHKHKHDTARARPNAILVMLGLLGLAFDLPGNTLLFQGTLATPEDIFTETFTIGVTQNVAIATWGFGGGTASGNVIPAGGFDPLVALYAGDLSTASIITAGGNPAADADTLSTFVGNCPPAGMVTIGTGSGSSICGDVRLVVDGLAPGIYTLVLSDANYVPVSVNPGPPSSSLLSDGFTDFTGGVFQTCNTTSDGTFCITPTGNYAVEILGSAEGALGPQAIPEPGYWLLMAAGLAALAARKNRTDLEKK
jgi:hypothetical protein